MLVNHSSHLSIDAIQNSHDHGVTMLTLPPHYTHKMQPLDMSVFSQFKSFYAKECRVNSKQIKLASVFNQFKLTHSDTNASDEYVILRAGGDVKSMYALRASVGFSGF